MNLAKKFIPAIIPAVLISCSAGEMTAGMADYAETRSGIILRTAGRGDPADRIDSIAFFVFNASGDLENAVRSDGNAVSIPLFPGRYTCMACSGDIPPEVRCMDDYQGHMPSLAYNCYDTRHKGFSFTGSCRIDVGGGTEAVTSVVQMRRNFCKVIIESVNVLIWEPTLYGLKTGFVVDSIILADIPLRTHMSGLSDDSGSCLVNHIHDGTIDLSDGSIARCTIGNVGDDLYCMPSDNGKIVIAATATFARTVRKKMYYHIPLQILANNANRYSIRITGPGNDNIDIPDPKGVEYDVESWEEEADYTIKF